MLAEAEQQDVLTEDYEGQSPAVDQAEVAHDGAEQPKLTPDEVVDKVESLIPDGEERRDFLIRLAQFAIRELAPSHDVNIPFGPYICLSHDARASFAKTVQAEAITRALRSVGLDIDAKERDMGEDSGVSNVTYSIIPKASR